MCNMPRNKGLYRIRGILRIGGQDGKKVVKEERILENGCNKNVTDAIFCPNETGVPELRICERYAEIYGVKLGGRVCQGECLAEKFRRNREAE